MTLATSWGKNTPWCASCFYLYQNEFNRFIFTTDEDTRHGFEMSKNPVVAACIALETRITGKIRGVQITGVVKKVSAIESRAVRTAFIKRFPLAAIKQINLWVLEPDHIKMTDNRLGFGKKLLWYKKVD